MQVPSSTQLKPARYQRKMLLGYKVIPGVPHGVLDIVIEHTKTEREEYRLQQVPKKIYIQLLCMPEPEQTMNNVLRMWGLG